MSAFTLTLVGDDKMILSTTRSLSPAEYEVIKIAFDEWLKGPERLLFLSECEVWDRRKALIELDVSPAEVRHERLLEGSPRVITATATTSPVSPNKPRERCGDCDGVGWVDGEIECSRCHGHGWEDGLP